MISDLSLMKIQVGTLFVHDDEERLRFINEPYRPEDHPAPVFFLDELVAVLKMNSHKFIVCKTENHLATRIVTRLVKFSCA